MRKTDRQNQAVVNKTRSNIFGWRGQFKPSSQPIEFERFGNCGEFATIKIHAGERMESGSNPVEFDGIKNSGKCRSAWLTV